jgi:hypothetical protein
MKSELQIGETQDADDFFPLSQFLSHLDWSEHDKEKASKDVKQCIWRCEVF